VSVYSSASLRAISSRGKAPGLANHDSFLFHAPPFSKIDPGLQTKEAAVMGFDEKMGWNSIKVPTIALKGIHKLDHIVYPRLLNDADSIIAVA
jgi:hypothetical protein